MKKLITYVCLIVVVILGFSIITKGNETFKIVSYKTIGEKSDSLTQKLAVYDKMNQDEYDSTCDNLKNSIKSYQDSKAKYEAIVEELSDVLSKKEAEDVKEEEEDKVVEEIIYSDKEKYKVDFLLVTLGDYGEREGVDVVYQLTTSPTVDPNSTTLNYFLADLKFTVTGEYMNVVNFISDLEDNDKLNWEIKSFNMEAGSSNGYQGVTAKFVIEDVPIDSESYITTGGSSSGSEEGSNRGTEASDSGNSSSANTESTDAGRDSTGNAVTDSSANTSANAKN